jgi:lysophospholipase
MSALRKAAQPGPAVEIPQPPPGGHAQRMTSPAGGTIRYMHWRATRTPAIGTALVLPGFGEFIEKYHETANDLLARGFEVFVMEWFGQGLSTRPLRNRGKVHVPDFARYLVDLGRLVDTVLPPRDGARPRLAMAHSMGAHLLLRYLKAHPRAFDVLVFCSPLADINYGRLPRWLARAVATAACALGLSRAYLFGARDYDPRRVRFPGNRLTADRARFLEPHAWIARNPELAVGGPTFGWLRAAQRSIALARRKGFARDIRAPILVLAAAADRVVCAEASRRLSKELPNATHIEIADAGHELLRERDSVRTLLWQQIDGFLGLGANVSRPGAAAHAG